MLPRAADFAPTWAEATAPSPPPPPPRSPSAAGTPRPTTLEATADTEGCQKGREMYDITAALPGHAFQQSHLLISSISCPHTSCFSGSAQHTELLFYQLRAPRSISCITQRPPSLTFLLPASSAPCSWTAFSHLSEVSMRSPQGLSLLFPPSPHSLPRTSQLPSRTIHRHWTKTHIWLALHCAASTAMPHSLVRHRFQWDRRYLGLILFKKQNKTLLPTISRALTIPEACSGSQNKAVWLQNTHVLPQHF